MPPAAAVISDYQSPFPLCCGAFDIGEIEIEVQAVDDDITSSKSTQIVVVPGSFYGYENDKDKDKTSGRDDYFTSTGSDPLDHRSLADSFDSTDEIVEGSNEMKLMRRVVDKQRANKSKLQQHLQQQNAGILRQDSMSDTNSVNSNDVFVSIEDAKEMEYLDVLDQHMNQSNADNDIWQDSYPSRQRYQGNLDDIIEHLCAAPCGECLPDVDILADERNIAGGVPKSVLRIPRYSSPDKYIHSSVYRVADRGVNGQPILIHSSSQLQRPNSVQFQNVDIRNFKMTLGNHPSATTGPPVMLDGELMDPKHLARTVMALEKYEKQRPPRRKRRQLKLTLQQRHNILVKERGFSFEEVKGAWKESLDIRRQRRETLERGLAMMKWDEVWESTCRKFSRLVDGTL